MKIYYYNRVSFIIYLKSFVELPNESVLFYFLSFFSICDISFRAELLIEVAFVNSYNIEVNSISNAVSIIEYSKELMIRNNLLIKSF